MSSNSKLTHVMPTNALRATAGLVLALTLAAAGAATTAGASGPDGVAPKGDGAEGEVTEVTDPVAGFVDEIAAASIPAVSVNERVAAPVPPPVPAPPAPKPQPVRATAGGGGAVGDIIARHFGGATGRAMQIARCESGLNPGAVSHTNDHGLFQINIVHRETFTRVTGAPWSSIYDAELNTIYAKWLYDQQGWGPWVCNRKV